MDSQAFVPELGKLIPNVSYQDYAASEGLRNSDLKLLRRSPAHWLAAQKEEQKPSDAMRFGSLFHLGIENPERLRDLLRVEPQFVGKTKDGRDSTRSAEAKQMKAEWYASMPPGAIVVTEDEAVRLNGMISAVISHKFVGQIIKNSLRETSLWVTDPDTGITLKCRHDLITEKGHQVDFKTCRDASKSSFYQSIFANKYSDSFFYALQAAHYTHCAKLSGQKLQTDKFLFVAIESEAPFGIMVHALDEFGIEVGERVRKEKTKLFAECKSKNSWPCYEEKAFTVEIPGWVQWEEET